MEVSKNSGAPKSSMLIGFSIINHPFWGTPIFGNTHMVQQTFFKPFDVPPGRKKTQAISRFHSPHMTPRVVFNQSHW